MWSFGVFKIYELLFVKYSVSENCKYKLLFYYITTDFWLASVTHKILLVSAKVIKQDFVYVQL